MLCETCEKLLQGLQARVGSNSQLESNRHNEELEHHTSYNSFHQAIWDGCSICKRLQHTISEDQKSDFRMHCSWNFPMDSTSNQWLPENTICLSFHATSTPVSVEDFDLVPVQPGLDRLRFHDYEITNSTSSPACLALANRWLMTCRNEHTTCERVRLQSQSSWAPTRLIYIDRQSGSLKLEESDTIPLGVRYTTLSHCWGRVPDKLVLTVANVASWKHALPSLGKMKTFEDAIEISQRLGVPYIWIDSLCIIQDSRDDWIAESSRMSDVYKYSFCNICATAAADDTGGCFFSRDPSIALPFRIQFTAHGSSHESKSHDPVARATAMDQSSRSLQGAYDLHRQGKWVLEIGGAPVNRRAWVVQERFLTPRVLNFGKSQLYWECNELQASESYPDGVPKEPNGDVMFKATTPFNLIKRDYANSDTSNTSNASYGLDDLFGLWAVAVDAFTGCGLTKEEDKLVAISAIAREMQPLMQCRYLAGHWEVDFVRQLAWTALNFSYRASVYRAPSWSWASVDGIIDHFQYMYETRDEYHPLIEIIETQIDLATHDKMGQVKGGFLHARGQLIEIDIKHTNHLRYGMVGGYENQIILVNGLKTMMHLREDDESHPLSVPIRLLCLPVDASLGDHLRFNALVLERTDEADAYRRVGYLGPNSGVTLRKKDFDCDPLLQLLGKIEWNSGSANILTRETSAMVEFTIL